MAEDVFQRMKEKVVLWKQVVGEFCTSWPLYSWIFICWNRPLSLSHTQADDMSVYTCQLSVLWNKWNTSLTKTRVCWRGPQQSFSQSDLCAHSISRHCIEVSSCESWGILRVKIDLSWWVSPSSCFISMPSFIPQSIRCNWWSNHRLWKYMKWTWWQWWHILIMRNVFKRGDSFYKKYPPVHEVWKVVGW